MDYVALTALVASIRHWERLSTGQRLLEDGIGIGSCDLCLEFYNKDCSGCPVRERTGKVHCRNTPYEGVAALVFGCAEPTTAAIARIFDSEEFKEAAKKELEFLRSFLPQ